MDASLSRRNFLKSAGAAGIGLGLAPFAIAQSAPSPRPVRCAVIGLNNRGAAHVDAFGSIEGVSVPVLCDVDAAVLAKAVASAQKSSAGVRGVSDFRKILEDSSIDAVAIATPDHWHAPMAILALQAGKAVYLEKPCSHNPREGELLLQAIEKTNGIVQMGNQRRSFPNVTAAIKAIHDGEIGRAYFAKAWYANGRGSIGVGKAVPVPDGLDFDLWQGPAPRREYRDNIVPYKWHWFWHWGTGEALNNGTHEVDVCRWALGVDFPSRVSSTGGRFAFKDDWECPDTQVIGWEFPGGKSITWEGRSCNPHKVEGLDRGALIYGTEGTALIESDNATFFDPRRKIIRQFHSQSRSAEGTNTVSSTGAALDQLHFLNFIETVRGNASLNSPISEGHKSVTILHLGNIAQRVGRDLHTDPATGHITNDAEAEKLWSRDYEPGWEPRV